MHLSQTPYISPFKYSSRQLLLNEPQRAACFGEKKDEQNPFELREGEVGRQCQHTNDPWHLGSNKDGSTILTGFAKFLNALGDVVRVVTYPYKKGDSSPNDHVDFGSRNN